MAQLAKNPPAMRGTWFDPWLGKIPWRRERLPTPVFWPGELHGLYILCGHKSRTRQQLLHSPEALVKMAKTSGRRTLVPFSWIHPSKTDHFSGVCFLAFFVTTTKSFCTVPCQQSFLRWKTTDVSGGSWHLSLPSLWCALPHPGPCSSELTLETSLKRR